MTTPDPALAPWKPRDLGDVRCGVSCPGLGCRTPSHILAVVAAACLETDPRYETDSYGCPGTRCNIWVGDGTRVIVGPEEAPPHWADKDGNPKPVGQGVEENANEMIEWLDGNAGHARRWAPVGMAEAQLAANQGQATVVGWHNPGGIGHVALVLPMPTLGWGWGHTMGIAQAGKVNFSAGPLTRGFGYHPVNFWTHP